MRLRFYLALGLALAVLVTGGGSPAHALVKPEEVLKQGGQLVKGGKGVSRFARLVPGPVGGILTAGSLAWWAYEQLDGAEVHAPQPGGDTGDWLGAPEPSYPSTAQDAVLKAEILFTAPRTIKVKLGCTAGWTPWNAAPTSFYTCIGMEARSNLNARVGGGTFIEVKCRDLTTSVVTTRSFSGNLGGNMSKTYSGGLPPTSTMTEFSPGTQCVSGEEVLEVRLDPGTTTGTWQTLQAPIGYNVPAGVTYPEGTVTFSTAVIDATCRNAETGATQHIYGTSAWGASQTLALPSCKARLGDDWYGVGLKVIPMDPEIEGVPLDPEIWPDWDVPDFVPEEWTEDELTPEEEADPCHGTKTGCGLTVNIDDEPVFPGSTTRTKIDTLIGNEPDRVTCKWGSREVEWKWCIPLLPTFEPGSGGSTTTDPTKPDTGTGVPTTGTGTQPVPTDAKNCIAGAFSWNPVDWVFVPVKCALQWAFKPTTALETRIARVKTAFENKPPFSWLVGLGSLPSISGGGCPTHWEFSYKGDSWPILCGTAVGNALHAFRPVSVVLLLGAAVYPFIRALVYAAFPIVKPVPHD